MAGCNTSACRRTLTAESTRTERQPAPVAQLGDPAVEVLHFGLDVYAACDTERREIMARRMMTPHGYNESSGGEYAGSRSDTLFSSDHLHRLSRAAVGVERMDGATHEEEAGSLAASGVEAVMEPVLGGVLGCGRALGQWRLCGTDRTARGSWTRLHLRDTAGCGETPNNACHAYPVGSEAYSIL